MEEVLHQLRQWLEQVTSVSGVIQLLLVLSGAGMAWWFHRYWENRLINRLGISERKGLMRATLRSTQRVAFPLVMLVVLYSGSGVMHQMNYPTHLLDILIPLVLSLAIVRVVVYVLRRAFVPGPLLRAWEGIIATIVWSGVALYLLGWLPDVITALDRIGFNLGSTRISLLSGGKLLFAVAAFVVVAGWLSRLIEQRARRSEFINASFQVGLTKFSKFFLYTIAILIALNSVGIDLTTLTVFGGALGVGLGFGLQRIASNFISGFILLFDRSIKPGDVISIEDRFGWVQALHARYVVIRDRDGVETLIPNENLVTSQVINWSYSDRNIRIKLPVQVSYSSDPELAMSLMEQACDISPRILKDPAPAARLISFGDNGINLELRLWLQDPEEGVGNIRSDVNVQIWRLFKENNIEIPFPQRDVHIIES